VEVQEWAARAKELAAQAVSASSASLSQEQRLEHAERERAHLKARLVSCLLPSCPL